MGQSLAIVGAAVVTMDDRRTILDEGTVVVEDGRFASIGPGHRDPGADVRIDGHGRVLLPGLINCHLHTRPGRALGDGLSLFDWHALYPDGLCRQMDDDDSRAGALLAFAETLRSGTTTVFDMTCHPAGAFAAAEEIGIRARISPLAADSAHADGSTDVYEEFVEQLEALPAAVPGDRVQYWLGFDAVNGVTEETLCRMAADAARLRMGVHGHMSESKEDTAWTEQTLGLRAAVYLERTGILGPRTVLAHCNWLTDDEIDVLARTGITISHNPTSNMKLGTGVCPVGALREAGANVGLGTDGMLSNFHLNMFEVMRGACLLQRIHHLDADALMSEDVLEMATRAGARALGLAPELGVIATGYLADAILVDLRRPHLRPVVRGDHDNLTALLVWCVQGADVETVIVDGRVVVEHGRLALAEEGVIIEQAQRAAERLLAQIPARKGEKVLDTA